MGSSGDNVMPELDESKALTTDDEEDADELASMPDLKDLIGNLPEDWMLENVAAHYLELVADANRAETNSRANRAAGNEVQARHWGELRIAALAAVGRILKTYPKVKKLANEIAAAQVAQTRRNRAEFMAQRGGHDGK